MASYLIKLGGGLITDKSVPLYLRQDVLERVAVELARLYEELPSATWLIGNGAGSFGHYTVQAVRYKDAPDDPERIEAVRSSVVNLNQLVVTALRIAGVPAYGLSPHKFIKEKSGKLQLDYKKIEAVYGRGEIPIVYGDVIDTDDSTRIAPTEEVLGIIARHQLEATGKQATACVYASSVPGVLDSQGKTIRLLRKSDDFHVHTNDEDYDVTGGMAQKVAAGFKALDYAKRVFIVNGMVKGHIAKAVHAKKVDTQLIA